VKERRQKRNEKEEPEKREERRGQQYQMPSAIAIRKVEGKPGKVYYPLEKISIPEPKPEKDEVLPPVPVHLHAALTHPPKRSS
jgi:hypothetical protein